MEQRRKDQEEKIRIIRQEYNWYEGKPFRLFIPHPFRHNKDVTVAKELMADLKLSNKQDFFRRKTYATEEEVFKNPKMTNIDKISLDKQQTTSLNFIRLDPLLTDNPIVDNCVQSPKKGIKNRHIENSKTKVKNLTSLSSLLKKLFLSKETSETEFMISSNELRILTELLIRKNRKKACCR